VVTPEGLPLAYEVLPGNTAVLRDKQGENSASIRMRKCRRMRDEGRA